MITDPVEKLGVDRLALMAAWNKAGKALSEFADRFIDNDGVFHPEIIENLGMREEWSALVAAERSTHDAAATAFASDLMAFIRRGADEYGVSVDAVEGWLDGGL